MPKEKLEKISELKRKHFAQDQEEMFVGGPGEDSTLRKSPPLTSSPSFDRMNSTCESHQERVGGEAQGITDFEVEQTRDELASSVEVKYNDPRSSSQYEAEGCVHAVSTTSVTGEFDGPEAQEQVGGVVKNESVSLEKKDVVNNQPSCKQDDVDLVKRSDVLAKDDVKIDVKNTITSKGDKEVRKRKTICPKIHEQEAKLWTQNVASQCNQNCKNEMDTGENAKAVHKIMDSVHANVLEGHVNPHKGSSGNETSYPSSGILKRTQHDSGGALWDIFRREDSPKLQEYLREHYKEFRHYHCNPLKQVIFPLLYLISTSMYAFQLISY